MSKPEEIKKRLEAATPGPWYIKTRASEMGDDFTIEPNVVNAWATDGDFGTDLSIQNAELIANAPTDIATLLKTYEIMEKALKGLLQSEALKEAPFYNYCESVSNAKQALSEVQKLWEEKVMNKEKINSTPVVMKKYKCNKCASVCEGVGV